MVSLKYSVGTANKFVGLHVENDSSDDEEHTPFENDQPSSTPMPSVAESTFVPPTKNTTYKNEADNTRTQNNQNRNSNRNNQNTNQTQKPKGKNGYSNNGSHNDGDKWSESHSGKFNNSQEKFSRPRKQDRTLQGKARPRKEFNTQPGNEFSTQKFEKKSGKPIFKDQNQEASKGEDKISATVSTEKAPETEEIQKPTETPTEPEMMDLEAWKQQQAAKRISIPSAQGYDSTPDFKDELESKGYKLYVKPQEFKENDAQADDANGENQKKKASNTVNLFEYVYNEKGYVALFHGQRMRGRKNPSQRMDKKPKNPDYKTNDAPDFKDDRAFPALGHPKVLS